MKVRFVLVAMVLVSCRPSTPEGSRKDAKAPVDGSGPPALDAIHLEQRGDGLMYQTGADKPFSGTDIEPDEKKVREENRLGFVMVVPYRNGLIDGTLKIYYKSGQLQEARDYENGAAKFSTVYHPNGAKKTQVAYNGRGVAEGPYIRWHANGAVHTKAIFDINEKFHGDFKKWNPQGVLVAHYTLEHGTITKVWEESPEQKAERRAKSGSIHGEQ